jgi:transaldolase
VAQFARAGVDVYALAEWLQREGARSFGKSWEELMAQIASKSAELEHAAM